MSEPNEPPLEVAEYNIIVKWSDGNEEIIPKDFYHFCKDLHAQNSERFVNYEKKSD